MPQKTFRLPSPLGAFVLLATVVGSGSALAVWKGNAIRDSAAASAQQPEPMEVVTAATASAREHRASTTSIGTVLALQSVTLRNELAGTVRHVSLAPGRIVESGTILVALDVAVELADLRAREAQLALAETSLSRLEKLLEPQAVSAEEVDRARAERDVAKAEIARIRAIIERKTIRAPFRARVGIADVHPGQYLSEGTVLTTLQSVAEATHVDFTVAQNVAAALEVGDSVDITTDNDAALTRAVIVAIDARVDPATRNSLVRARVSEDLPIAGPGSSVRVRIPVGSAEQVVAVPVSAVRKGPDGDHVFVLTPDDKGSTRAHLRPVQTGEVVGDSILILGGLTAGDQVASSGSFKLREGVLVSLAKQQQAQANGTR
jgi:membrane fusion protein (multidrug efflux system)